MTDHTLLCPSYLNCLQRLSELFIYISLGMYVYLNLLTVQSAFDYPNCILSHFNDQGAHCNVGGITWSIVFVDLEVIGR